MSPYEPDYLDKFYQHVKKDLVAPKADVEMAHKKHNVVHSRFEIYRRFIFQIIDTVYETYLGHDCITHEEDIVNHFSWCYNHTCKEFKDTKLKFSENTLLFNYFCKYFKDNLYLSYEQRDNDIYNFNQFFNLENKNITNNQLTEFTKLYNIFDETHYSGRVLVNRR